PDQDELRDVVAFIAAQQVHPDRHITYLGTDAADITAELDGLKPPWAATARVRRDGTGIAGAVIGEWDEDIGRAWIIGPWVVGDGESWMAAAVELLGAGLGPLAGPGSSGRGWSATASRGWRRRSSFSTRRWRSCPRA